MKKSLIALLVVLALVITVSVFSVSANEPATASAQYSSDLTVNGDTATGYCPHCQKDVTWGKLNLAASGHNSIGNNSYGNHYFLGQDITTNGAIRTNVAGAEFIFHLNGHTYTRTGSTGALLPNTSNTKTFVVADTAGKGTLKNTHSYGQVVTMDYAGSLTLYSGNLVSTATTVVASAATAGNYYGGIVDLNTLASTFTMYGGSLSGGYAFQGGSIYANNASARINLYGGTISGGRSTDRGGNIYIKAGNLLVDGATIENGCTWGNQFGGNIYAEGNVTVSSGIITGGNTTSTANTPSTKGAAANIKGAGRGGNICIRGDYTLTMTGGTVSDGVAPYGGNITIEGTLTNHNLSGGTISGGEALLGGNVYIAAGTPGGTFSGTNVENGIVYANKTNNTNNGRGGNIYNTTGTFNITGGTFTGGAIADANATYVGLGANIYTQKAMTITNATLTGGAAHNGYGGNLCIHGGANVTLGAGTTVKDGTALRTTVYGQTAGQGMGGNIRVYNGTLTINGATITNTTNSAIAQHAGNIHLEGVNATSTANLKMISGTISGGRVLSFGGNIYATANSNVDIDGGTITGGNSQGGRGGNIYVYNTANVVVDNAIITDGLSAEGSNIMLYGATDGITLTNCTISDSATASANGGGIYNGGTVVLNNCTISGNIGDTGAAIYNKAGATVTMTGGSISGNTATTSTYTAVAAGGSVYNAGTFNMVSGTIENGIAQNSYKLGTGETVAVLAMGGNIYNEGIFTMTTGTISGGKAQRSGTGDNNASGGNVYNMGTFTMNDGTITDGEAVTDGGNIYVANGPAEFSGGSITNGTASNQGGNVYIGVPGGTAEGTAVTVTLSGTSVSGGTAVRGENFACNGASTTAKAVLNMTNGTIGDGKSNNNGTAVYLNANAEFNMSGGRIENVTTASGAITTNSYTDSVVISGGTIDNCDGNSASGLGGAIYCPTGNVTIKGGTIQNCSAFKGGAIYATGANAKIYVQKTNDQQYAVIKDCTATDRGGSIAVYASAQLHISGGEIKDGRLEVSGNRMGGNIHAEGGNVTMSGGTVSGGGVVGAKAEDSNTWDLVTGGNMHICGASTLTMTGGTISGGMANSGGNLYFRGTSTTNSITGGTIENGKAKTAGGNFASVTNAHTITLGAVTISGGYAGTTGGNIHTATGTYNMTGTTIENGTAGTTGGNIHTAKAMNLTNCTLTGGSAGTNGGSINAAAALTISGGSITGGHSNEYGGNIYVTAAGSTIENCEILNGVAGTKTTNPETGAVIAPTVSNSRGGNLAITAGITLTNCVIRNGESWCNATPGGGNIYVTANSTLTGCTITGGTAYNAGGNIVLHGTPTVTIDGDSYIAGGVSVNNWGGNIGFTNAAKLHLKGETVVDGKDAHCMAGTQYGNNIGMSAANKNVSFELHVGENAVIKNGDHDNAFSVSIAAGYDGKIPKVYLDGNAQVDKIYIREVVINKDKADEYTHNEFDNIVVVKSNFTGAASVYTSNKTYNDTVVPGADVYGAVISDGYQGTGTLKVLNHGQSGFVVIVDNGTLKVCGITGFKLEDPDGIPDSGDEYEVENGFATLDAVVDAGYAYAKLYVGGKHTLSAKTNEFPIDLNNQVVEFVTGEYKLAPIDYRTDGNVTAKYTQLTVDNDDNVLTLTQNPINGRQYLNVKGDHEVDSSNRIDSYAEGATTTKTFWTSNRVTVELTKVSIKTTKDGIYYTTKIGTNANAAPYLRDYGTAVSLVDDVVIDENFLDSLDTNGVLFTAFDLNKTGNFTAETRSALISGILADEHKDGQTNDQCADMTITATSFITAKVGDEEVMIMADETSKLTFKDIMVKLDDKIEELNTLQPEGYEQTIATAVAFYDKWNTLDNDLFANWVVEDTTDPLLKNLKQASEEAKAA